MGLSRIEYVPAGKLSASPTADAVSLMADEGNAEETEIN
jgi:hypothetical protein